MHPRVLWSLRPGDPLVLVREPGNPYDRLATAVYTVDGARLGYLPRGFNEPVALVIDQDVSVRAVVVAVAPEAAPWERVRVTLWMEVPAPVLHSGN